MSGRAWIAISWGIVMGALTFAAGPLASLSDRRAVAIIQMALTYLLIPGLILAAAVGSLIPAAAVNAVIHFALCSFVLRFVPAFKSKEVRKIDEPFGL